MILTINYQSIRIGAQRLVLLFLVLGTFFACNNDGLLPVNNKIVFPQNLSAHNIYQNNPSDLIPTTFFQPYELGASLFSDHSEKQRLIFLPAGGRLEKVDDGLPEFPEGTIIAKTFYYYKDVRDPSKGRKIIETRLLIKISDTWNAATYLWDEDQQEARLVEDGFNRLVNFIDKNGEPQVIAYQLPSNRACASCHNVNEKMSPIGPKLSNLNIDIASPTGPVNQLAVLQGKAMLNLFDRSTIGAVPDYHDTTLPLDERARAYLDINCAHCHSAQGSSPDLNMFYSYALPFEDTKIMEHKEAILSNMVEGSMPQIGTSVIDEEGAALIEAYINSL